MTAKLLLSVSAASVACALWRGGRFAWHETFANDAADCARFGHALARMRGTPAYVVVDAVEEDYRVEAMPHTSGGARHAMLARRLGQVYRNTPYMAAVWQTRLKDRRRDDQFLFTALTSPELVRPWVEILEAHGMPLAGVYPSSMVHQSLGERLKLPAGEALVVSESGGGMRQTFFHGGHLRASRLIAAPVLQSASPATLAAEIGKTRLYLVSLRLVGREDRLSVVLLDRDGSRAELARLLQADPGFECSHMDPAAIAARLRIPAASLAAGPAGLILHAMAAYPPRASLAPPKMARSFQIFQVRRATFAAASVVLAAGIGVSGYQLWQWKQASERAGDLRLRTAEQQALYTRAASQFPNAPTSAQNLRRAALIEAEVLSQRRSPERLMALVSLALERSPGIRISELKWALAQKPQPPGAAPAGTAAGPVEVGEVAGDVEPFDGNYKAAIGRVNALAYTLRESKGVAEVSVVELPLNVSSGTGLTGSTQEARGASSGAHFRLRLTLGEQ